VSRGARSEDSSPLSDAVADLIAADVQTARAWSLQALGRAGEADGQERQADEIRATLARDQ
jgi:hypothetical protein